MAYMSQERKKELVAGVKAMLKEKYPNIKIKATYSVQNHSAIVMTIRECNIDLLQDCGEYGKENGYIEVNRYHVRNHYSGEVANLLQDCVDCLNKGNYNNSDIMTDYFDVGWYVYVYVGSYGKPFKFIP